MEYKQHGANLSTSLSREKKNKTTASLGKQQHYSVAPIKHLPATKGNMTECEMLLRCN